MLLLALTVACGREAPPQPPSPAPAAAQTRGAPEATDPRPVVVFLGTSLTAGLGVPGDAPFPARIQERIDASGLGFRVVNAGVSGDTSAGGLRRIDWLLRQPVAVLVLELGANDMLRGQDVAAMRSNLEQIIARTRARHPRARIVVAGMQSAPNLGDAYAEAFARTFVEVARESDAALIPFLLDGVAGVPELNQPDGIHPTVEGHRRIADTVWRVLEPMLRDVAGAQARSSAARRYRGTRSAAPLHCVRRDADERARSGHARGRRLHRPEPRSFHATQRRICRNPAGGRAERHLQALSRRRRSLLPARAARARAARAHRPSRRVPSGGGPALHTTGTC